jgi:hypothetical protein
MSATPPPKPVVAEGLDSPTTTPPRSPEVATAMERLEMRMLRARVVRDVVQVVALTAAAVWAVYTFWYQASFLPANEVPNVVLSSTLEIVGERDGFVALKAHLRAQNPGKARVRIISESINLVGSRFSPVPSAPLGPAALPQGRQSWALGSGVDAAGSALLASQVDTPSSPSNLSLEPNEILERTHVFRVSKQDWDVATLTYYAVFNSQRQPAPNPEYLERRFDPDGITLLPLLPKGVRGTLITSNTTSRAIVVLPR